MNVDTPPQLGYRGRPPAPLRQLTVEPVSGGILITWPVPPAWTVYLTVGVGLALAAFKAVLFGTVGVIVFRLFRTGGGDQVRFLWRLVGPAVLAAAIYVVLWTYSSLRMLRQHRRWGQVPRTLTVTPDRVTLEWLGRRQMVRREWPAASATSVAWRPVTDIFSRRSRIVRVTVRFASRRPLRFTLSSRDAAVIDRAHAALIALVPARPAGG